MASRTSANMAQNVLLNSCPCHKIGSLIQFEKDNHNSITTFHSLSPPLVFRCKICRLHHTLLSCISCLSSSEKIWFVVIQIVLWWQLINKYLTPRFKAAYFHLSSSTTSSVRIAVWLVGFLHLLYCTCFLFNVGQGEFWRSDNLPPASAY